MARSDRAMRTIARDIASAVVLSGDGHMLLGQKDPASGRAYADGSWLIPGGGVEPGETVLEALARELVEEAGLDITPYPCALLEDDGGDLVPKTLPSGERVLLDMKFFTYRVDIDLPAAHIRVRPSDELPNLKWVPLAGLAELKLPAPSVALFTKCGWLRAQ
jgi:8-oxo-dGTP pyrophosphatase MutT (NUDIX family)